MCPQQFSAEGLCSVKQRNCPERDKKSVKCAVIWQPGLRCLHCLSLWSGTPPTTWYQRPCFDDYHIFDLDDMWWRTITRLGWNKPSAGISVVFLQSSYDSVRKMRSISRMKTNQTWQLLFVRINSVENFLMCRLVQSALPLLPFFGNLLQSRLTESNFRTSPCDIKPKPHREMQETTSDTCEGRGRV